MEEIMDERKTGKAVKRKLDKQKIALISVTVALLISVGYIAFSQYQAIRTQDQISAYQIGYTEAVVNLLQQVSTCKQVPITYGNTTINVIAVACLQPAE